MLKLSDLSLGGAIGLLCGIALVLWVAPTTSGGVAILVFISIVIGVVFGRIISLIVGSVSKILRRDSF